MSGSSKWKSLAENLTLPPASTSLVKSLEVGGVLAGGVTDSSSDQGPAPSRFTALTAIVTGSDGPSSVRVLVRESTSVIVTRMSCGHPWLYLISYPVIGGRPVLSAGVQSTWTETEETAAAITAGAWGRSTTSLTTTVTSIEASALSSVSPWASRPSLMLTVKDSALLASAS